MIFLKMSIGTYLNQNSTEYSCRVIKIRTTLKDNIILITNILLKNGFIKIQNTYDI